MPDPGYLLQELGYLKEEEAAQAIDVDEKTLSGYRKNGNGPDHTVVGRTILYSKTSLAKWLEAGGAREREVVPITNRRRAS